MPYWFLIGGLMIFLLSCWWVCKFLFSIGGLMIFFDYSIGGLLISILIFFFGQL